MQKKIKILQITANLGIGGLERVVVNLCKNLNPHLFNVAVCCLKFKGEFASELEQNNITVHLLSEHKPIKPDYTAFWKLKNVYKKYAPHIIHTHNTNSFIDSTIATFFKKIPCIVNTDHGRDFPGHWKERIFESLLSRKADAFVAVSDDIKKNLMHYEWISEKKIKVIHNGISGDDYDIQINKQTKTENLGLSKYDKLIGLGVRLTKQKGIVHLINAIPEVLKSFPKTGVVIAGKGPLKPELLELCWQNRISDHVHFIGPRLDLPEIINILDIFVLPSEWEGLPLALLEAMAAGRAIIATEVGANAQVIEHEKSGLLIKPKNPKKLSEAICNLLNDEKKRILFGKNAKKRFYESFSAKIMAKNYENLYMNIL